MRFFGCIFFLLLSGALHSQNRAAVAAKLSSNQQVTDTYRFEAPQSGRRVVWLEMPFASATFVHPSEVAQLRGLLVERVDLVYTQFAVSLDFNQQGLNNRRLAAFLQLLPGVAINPLTEWRLIGQSGASSPESGRTFFHGFVVVVREPVSPELSRSELRFLDSLLGGGGASTIADGSGSTSVSGDPSGEGITTIAGREVRIRRNIPNDSLRFFLVPTQQDGSIVEARWTDSAHTTIAYTERIMDHRMRRTVKLSEDSLRASGPLRSRLLNGYSRYNPDSVIISTFQRNGWRNVALVCDVTGSMSPYTAQLFAWLQAPQTTSRCSGFLFFNDGDSKKTSQKAIGRAGGLYAISSTNFDSISRTAVRCMNGGDGGDLPENYLEALLAAVNRFPTTTELVLIADNFSSPRDMELFSKLNRPVHIILCGARSGVNPDYLFLARQTGGSVHTVTQDVTNLSTLKDGEYVQIGRQRFLLRDERFIMITENMIVN